MKLTWVAPLALLVILAATPKASIAAQSPRVVVSIAPVHALVAGVMEGVGKPELLVPGGASPHVYSLKPSQARALSKARMVIRVSSQLETFLERAIGTLAVKATVVTLTRVKGMTLYEPRHGGLWEQHNENGDGAKNHEDHAHEQHEHEGRDPHIWLDPNNAKRIVDAVAMTLQKTYPEHAEIFTANAEKIATKLDELDHDLSVATKPLRGKPYIVFHDAYRYFEERYKLTPAGAITISPDRPAGARRLSEIHARIKSQAVTCVFVEPQFQPKLVQTLISGTGVRTGTLDTIGAGLKPAPELYFKLMNNLASSMAACLNEPS
jgi:zinc transport system substrate-binding protein